MTKPYETYKDSGVEWIGHIPKHWKVVKFKFLTDIYTGNSLNSNLKVTFQSNNQKDLPYVSTKDVNIDNNTLNYENGLRIPSENSIYKVAPKGSFLLCIEGANAGKKLAYVEEDCCFVNKLACFNYPNKFLFYYAQSHPFKTQFFNSITGLIGGVSTTVIKEFLSSIPSPNEQIKIANYLDYKTSLLDNIIAQKEQLTEKLKEQRQAIINEAVTKGLNPNAPLKDSGIEWLGEIPEHWEVVKLKFLGESITGITYSPSDVSDDGTLVLRSSNIQNGRLALNDKVYVNKVIADKYLTVKGDILLCSRNGSRKLIGKNIMLDERVENETWGAFMTVYRSNYNDFMYFFFNSDIFSALSSLFLSSTINQLTIGVLNNMQIAFPKEETERKLIIDYLTTRTNEINKVIRLNKKQIQKLKEYRQSIISEAVTGKIDVRDWKPKTA